jgi:uncharacterized protein YkwD
MLKKLNDISIVALALGLTACGGGGDSGNKNTENQFKPTIIQPTTPVTPPSQPTTPTVSTGQIYKLIPDVADCQAGQLTLEVEQAILNKLNEIRKLHGLAPVSYDETHAEQMMRTALVMTAKRALSHTPDNSWNCYHSDALNGASTSNLYLIHGTNLTENTETLTNDLVAWLIDEGVESSGHRRWLLDPFLKKVAYGSVSGIVSGQQVRASSLKVIYGNQGSTTVQNDVIAYPMGDYPKAYFKQGTYLSISILVNTSSSASNSAVDFSPMKIQVKQRGGQTETPLNLSFNNNFMGLPNHLQFKLGHVDENVIYDVHLDNVIVNGVPRTYDYWFQLK